jgi:hypothetical protein
LGGRGGAFKNPDGHDTFPCAARRNCSNAIHSIGKSDLADKSPLWRFIMKRAKALGASRRCRCLLEVGPSGQNRVTSGKRGLVERGLFRPFHALRGGPVLDRQRETELRGLRASENGDLRLSRRWHP